MAKKNPGGRPKLDIAPDKVRQLALLGASDHDIGAFFNTSHVVIGRRFSPQLIAGRAHRRVKLRKWQWDSAEKGNVTMQIWLGKNELGQTDHAEVDHTGGMKIEVVYRKPKSGGNSSD